MNIIQRIFVILLISLLFVAAAASSATADDIRIYDWPDEYVPVLIVNETGMLMMNQNAEPVRVFDWDANDGERDRAIRLLDIDADGSPNVIGSGNPTFVTDSAGVPIFSFDGGCDQIVVADIIRESETDLVCVDGSELRVHSHRGSRAWSVDLGRAIDWCHAGDLTGDTNPDIECKFRGAEQYIRFRPDGDIITDSAEQAGVSSPVELDDQFQPVDDAVFTGERTFDLDGDGTAGESIHAEGASIEIHKEGEDDPIATVETSGDVKVANVVEFTQKDSPRIVAVTTNNRIYVIGDAGESVSDYSGDASEYRRVPHADFDSLHANGFEDNDAVRELVREVQDDIAQCYGDRLRQAPFAGSGRLNLQLFVGDDGEIQNVNQRHSGVRDNQIEECAKDAVRGINYPAAEGPRGIVTVNLIFSFIDEA